MTKRKALIIWTIILIVVTSCSVKEQTIIYRERNTLRTTTSRLDSLYSDSLMVFFEQGFNNTLIKIKINDETLYKENITTAEEIQLATVKNIGFNKKVQDFSISLNEGKFIPIKIISPFKYVAVNYLEDTVYIDYMVHYPMYE